jgi:hypothetical protein
MLSFEVVCKEGGERFRVLDRIAAVSTWDWLNRKLVNAVFWNGRC